jgi:imidazole glycerol phosphate synthase glutamine amidotransferase subunit
MSRLVVLDIGAGNVASMVKALRKLGATPEVVKTPEELATASRIVFPGVGVFGAAMKEIRRRGLDAALADAVKRDVPLLGVAVGLQLLFQGSQESPDEPGLGLLPGKCVRLSGEAKGEPLKVPEIGWNQVTPREDSHLFQGIEPGSNFYFVHAYHAVPVDRSLVAATCEYGLEYACACERGRLAAVQFHPEKSGPKGLTVLANFLGL